MHNSCNAKVTCNVIYLVVTRLPGSEWQGPLIFLLALFIKINKAEIMLEKCGNQETKQNYKFTQGQNVSEEAVNDRNRIFTNLDKNVGRLMSSKAAMLDLSANQT